MATLKIYLDTRACSPNGLAPLKIAINHKSKTAYIPLNLKIAKENWDSKTEKIIAHPQKNVFNNIIQARKVEVQKMLLEIGQTQRLHSLTATDIKNAILRFDQQQGGLLFLPYYEKMMKSKTLPTQQSYLCALVHIKAFGGDNLKFSDINRIWLKNFDSYLTQKGMSQNTRCLYLGKIKAVFNDALADEVINSYPFRRFELRRENTKKRSLSIEQIRQIFDLRPETKGGRLALDVFKLTFCLIGINAADLAADSTVINNGRVEYFRAKTKRFYSIKIEKEIEDLYQWFVDNKPYKKYKDLHSFEMTVNITLKKVTHLSDISLYWARHSWATIAAGLDVPKETIAAALGHSQSTVTDIYIKFDNRKIDAANREVLDYVFNAN